MSRAPAVRGGGGTARAERMERARDRMRHLGVEALVLSHGADMPWLCGYEAMPLERLTLLVVPADDTATLLVPALEAPRVVHEANLFALSVWGESESPVALAAKLVGSRRSLAVSDRAWASTLMDLRSALPDATWRKASEVTSPLRAVKDHEELWALRLAAKAADRVAAALVGGEIALLGRTEADVSAEISERLLAEGHERVNFAIVGSGPNAASPHHQPGARTIGRCETVVCDFGGAFSPDGGPGYCSDITRTVVTGDPPANVRQLYAVLREAQESAVAAARVGRPCEEVDAVAREVISGDGFGECFIHRTGHGIGLEEHEDPYIVTGNKTPLAPGHAFSVEPGIYVAGSHGARLEDIVVATERGPESLNKVEHDLAVVEA